MYDILKKVYVVIAILMKLFFVLLVGGLGVVSLLSWIGFASPSDAIIGSQISMLLFGIVIYDFKKHKIIYELKNKINKDVVFEALRATAIILLVNVILSFLMKTNGEHSETVDSFVNEMNFPSSILLSVFVAPLFEELTFRSGLKYVLVDKHNFSNIAYVLISAIIFGGLHYQPGPLALTHVLLTGAIGIIYAILYLKTKNIYIPMISHLLYNGLVMLVAYSLIT